MEQYKQEFIEFMVDCQALKFGEFTLKSGRKSPFFMNAGAYVTGSQLMKLGESYAKAIHDTYGDDFDVLFGPAYKGIPLTVTTAIAMNKLYGVLEISAVSYGYAMVTYTGQNYGAKRYDRIKSGVKKVVLLSLATSILISIILWFFGPFFLSCFISNTSQGAKEAMTYGLTFLY